MTNHNEPTTGGLGDPDKSHDSGAWGASDRHESNAISPEQAGGEGVPNRQANGGRIPQGAQQWPHRDILNGSTQSGSSNYGAAGGDYPASPGARVGVEAHQSVPDRRGKSNPFSLWALGLGIAALIAGLFKAVTNVLLLLWIRVPTIGPTIPYILAILGVVLGFIAVTQAKYFGENGKRRASAVFGLILSIFSLIILVVLSVVITIWVRLY